MMFHLVRALHGRPRQLIEDLLGLAALIILVGAGFMLPGLL